MKSKIKQKISQINKPPVPALQKIKNLKSANTISAFPIP